jgi:energy-coupling factor transporter ATP-binding protein EcfA2
MTLSDLLTIEGLQDSFELDDAAAMRRRLLGEPDQAAVDRLDDILSAYTHDDPELLGTVGPMLERLSSGDGKGEGFLITGPAGAGKSHLLATLLLLAGAPDARKRLARRQRQFADHLKAIHEMAPLLVVPLPLEEHSGREELLEDIIFERAEWELRRPPHEIVVPLSQHSYALELIERHVVPRFADDLDEYTADRSTRGETWEQLRERDEEAAVRIGHQFAQSINYPLDFRQSRVERMARLLEIVDGERLSGVLYLIDDLGDFLSSVDDKAMQGDLVFLEFLAHRGKIAPIWTVATMEMPLREIPGMEASLARRISDLYRGGLSLSAAHMRSVVAHALRPAAGEASDEALEQMVAAHESAFGEAADADALIEHFPLHPQAAHAAEELAARVLGRADGLLLVLRAAQESGLLAERTHLQPLGLPEVFDLLQPQLRSNPDAAPYLGQALEYYEAHGAEVAPAQADLLRRVIRALTALRLANLWPGEDDLWQALGMDAEGKPVADRAQVREVLEAARLHGRFVEVRRGREEAEDVYYIEVHTPIGDTLRERLSLAREGISRDDPRLMQTAIAYAGPTIPLGELKEETLLEVHWRNTARAASASLAPVHKLDELEIDRRVQELSEPANLANVHLYIATLTSADQQRSRWREITDGAMAGRWSASVLCWIPRSLHERELDALRDCAACRLLLSQRKGLEQERGLLQRLEEEEARLGAQVADVVRAAYYEGTVESAFGEAVSSAELSAMDGDWRSAISTMAAWSLERVFPEFARIAPRQFLSERRQIDLLIDRFIRPGYADPEPDSRLGTLIEAFMIPLGVARREDTPEGPTYLLDIARSAAADEVMQRIRARDQTPETQRGRPLVCADLAEHLLKSELGLPPELFELLIASLIRRGHLMALDEHETPVQLADIPTPIARHLQMVARPALLSYEHWQKLSRLTRIVFDQAISNPDHAAQAIIWEALIEAREEWLERIGELRAAIDELRGQLDQPQTVWRETFSALGHVERFFNLIDPAAYPAEGLANLIEGADPYLDTTNGVSKLRDLLRVVELLEHFAEDVAPQIVALRQYLKDEDLWLPEDSDIAELRDRLLATIDAGEEAVGEEQTIVRLAQVFFARYKRRYSAWHNAVYRASEFEPYNTLRATPEMRVLSALDRLDIEVEHDLSAVNDQIERELAKRCRELSLSQELETRPVCPSCGLRLGEEIHLRAPEEVSDLAARGVQEYVGALRSPANQRALADYLRSLPHRGETVRKLAQLVRMPEDMGARALMPLLGDDVLTHLQRSLAGQNVRSRSLSELRRQLSGRTLSRDEALEIVRQWLVADGEGTDEDLLHIEP